MKKIFLYIILFAACLTISCKKFVEIDAPKTEIVMEKVFENDATAVSTVNGIYSLMMAAMNFANGGSELYSGLSCDELFNHARRIDQVQFATNNLLPTNANIAGVFWGEAYKYIVNANSLLEGLAASGSLTPSLKSSLEGEAKFVRAFCHFYLVNMFGDVPYITSTDYRVNSALARNNKQDVYAKMIADLTEARNLLQADFLASGNKRTRPTKDAATALLARIYLYTANWSGAETMSSELIGNTATYSLLADLNAIFKANNKETIWELQPVRPSTNTMQASAFIVTGTPNEGNIGAVSMTASLYNAFETGDSRKTNWTKNFTNASGSYNFIYKYKVNIGTPAVEYNIVFRLAEQYLIRAEARARLNNFTGARDDLNKIRNRASLANTTAADEAGLLTAIEQERRIELMGESGHRWLDLKRWNRADAVLGGMKPGWQPTDTLYPIPQAEILLNPHLVQNQGY